MTTVMVVDDHPIWRDAVARDLADDGFTVVATADGVATADLDETVAVCLRLEVVACLGDGQSAR